MRYLLLALLIVSGYSFADASTNTVNREKYERVIEKQFPGFRIMREEDFDEMYKGHLQDGKTGSLVFGNFDSDEILDFAAYLIGPTRKTMGDGKTPIPPRIKLYDGAIVICHGNKQGSYVCEKMFDEIHWGREESEISVVPRGGYECMEEDGKFSFITSKYDSIGQYSEKGGGFYVRQSDGTFKECTTSD